MVSFGGNWNQAGRLTDMNRISMAVLLLAAGLWTPALAQSSKVGDWTIEKRTQDNHCNASRGYKDADDENREYVIVLTYSDKAIVFVIIYDGWEWEKTGEVLHADFSTDDDDIMKAAKWEVMDKTTVRGLFEFDQSILDKLKNAKRVYLDFENDEDDSVEVQTPKAGEVLGALKFCEENKK
jgi:invasion protein IalB